MTLPTPDLPAKRRCKVLGTDDTDIIDAEIVGIEDDSSDCESRVDGSVWQNLPALTPKRTYGSAQPEEESDQAFEAGLRGQERTWPKGPVPERRCTAMCTT